MSSVTSSVLLMDYQSSLRNLLCGSKEFVTEWRKDLEYMLVEEPWDSEFSWELYCVLHRSTISKNVSHVVWPEIQSC